MTRKETWPEYILAVVKGRRSGIAASLLKIILKLLSGFYFCVIWLLCRMYDSGFLGRQSLPCFVVSLGNITVGGTGKTPTAERMASEFINSGYRVAVLNRGYRGTWRGMAEIVSDGDQIYMTAQECGDEAYLLAMNLPGAGVVIGKDRYTSGLLAVKELGAQVLIIDDGFQHWQLFRDIDVVLVDATDDLAHNHILPRGTLREPLRSLRRASMFFLTKTEHVNIEKVEKLKELLHEYNESALVVSTNHKPAGVLEIEDWYAGRNDKMLDTEVLNSKRVLAFSALGNPASFENTLKQCGSEVYQRVRFPDHHDYSMAEMQRILIRAVASGVDALVTTEKDAVKIPSEFIHRYRKLPIYVLKIQVYFREEQEYDIVYEKIRTVLNEKTLEINESQMLFD